MQRTSLISGITQFVHPVRRAEALLGRRGWTPINLGASLLGWWTTDRADLITLSGAQVTSWKDVIANYNVVQAVSGARPLYSATSFNGSPGITFDGVDDNLALASSPFPAVANPSSLWALVDQTALVADTAARVAVAYGSNTGGGRYLYRSVVSGQNRVTLAANIAGGAATVSEDFSGRHVARGVISATGITVEMDGISGSSSAGVPNTATTRTRIGADVAITAGQFFKGVMRDIIVTGPLSATQAALLTTYLMNRRNP